MKNLGKIIIVWIMLYATLFAQEIEVVISPKVIFEGDNAKLTIIVTGDDVEFPSMSKIGDADVLSQASSSNFTSLNGKITKTKSKSYTFIPKASMTIEPITIKIDSKEYQTKPIRIEVKKEPANSAKAFIFEMEVDKNKAYVSEPVKVTYRFKHRLDIDIAEANFNPPSYEGFWTKSAPKKPNKIEGDYNVYEMSFILFPQKEGELKIDPARMSVGIVKQNVRSYFNFERIKWKTIFSNDAKVVVQQLPSDATLFGNFDFKVSVDKNQTKANEPINITLIIKGEGNVDDIEDFKIDLSDAIVYADKPKKRTYLTDKKVVGEFTQKFAVVSNRDFTIPPISFSYFDSDKNETVHKKSKPITIKVKGGFNTQTLEAKLEKPSGAVTKVKEKIVYQKSPWWSFALIGLGGFVLGFLVSSLLKKGRKKAEKELIIGKKIKNSSTDKELLSTLMPYVNQSSKLDALISKLEENIYNGKNHSIDKKDLSKNFEHYLKDDRKDEILL